jgi:uncharacterized protein (DUF1499 family)
MTNKTRSVQRFLMRLAIGVGLAAAAITALLAILARVVKSPANLGVTEGKLAPCPNSPNCVSSQSQDPRHQMDPIPYTSSPAEAKATLLQIIRSMERTTIITEDPTYIHAEFKTKGIGYVDDVELYIDQQAGVIHFRSSARLPYWDWNVNRERMQTIRAAFEAAQP